MARIFGSLVLAVAIAPAASGQAPQSLECAWETSRPMLQFSLEASSETPALSRVEQILSRGGAVRPEDKGFLREWFPPLLAEGRIGRVPTSYERDTVQGWFPKLSDKGDWRVTGEACGTYNCISWSAGVNSSWLWPGDSVSDFDKFYLSYGYVPLSAGEPVGDADIALWHASDGTATHGCRRVNGDVWESKLGSSLRILHRLDELQGAAYGSVAKFYRGATPEELRALAVTPIVPSDQGDPCGLRVRSMEGPYDMGSPQSKRIY